MTSPSSPPFSQTTNGSGKPRFTPGQTIVEPVPENYEFEHLRPHFPDVEWPALTEIPVEDKGLLGSPDYRDLLEDVISCVDYVPKIGTEITLNKSLRELSDSQRNDFARLIAFRGVVIVRDQHDFTLEDQLELGRYWGPLHRHATTSLPRNGYEEVHVIWTDTNTMDQRALYTPSYLWHSEVTYEIQPPSYTSLQILTGPPAGGGGDTVWSSQYAVYDRLSPAMQKYLSSLTALHSAEEQVAGSIAAGRPVRRDAIVTEHPLIRTNPVTGWNSLYYNPGFVTSIKGVPKLESDAIKAYLDQVIVSTVELQARYHLRRGSIAFWDNRTCNHTASFGFMPHRRHAVRVTPHGERPRFDPNGKSQEEELLTKMGMPLVNKDGAAAQSNYND